MPLTGAPFGGIDSLVMIAEKTRSCASIKAITQSETHTSEFVYGFVYIDEVVHKNVSSGKGERHKP